MSTGENSGSQSKNRDKVTARLSFDVTKEEHDRIKDAAGRRAETIRDFVLKSALGAGTFRFYRTANESPVQEFLRDPDEVIMAGIALTSIQTPGLQERLSALIAERRVRMTFLTIDPDLVAKDRSVYSLLNRRYEYSRNNNLSDELRATHDMLKNLYRQGLESKAPVRVLACGEVPMCGMVVVNPFTRTCKLRVSYYLAGYHGLEPDPFLEVDTATPEGRDVGDVFLRHYERLVAVSNPPSWVGDWVT